MKGFSIVGEVVVPRHAVHWHGVSVFHCTVWQGKIVYLDDMLEAC